MSANENYYDEDDFEGENLVKQLRKANKEKEKQLKELQDQLSSIQKQTRERSVKDVLTSRGLNPKIAAFIPSDLDPSEDAISKWVDDYADVFGGASAKQETASQMTPEQQQNLAALNAIQATQQTAAPFNSDPAHIASQINNVATIEDLNRLLHGNPNGPNAF